VNELVSVPISPWHTVPAAVGLLALTFVFAPGVLLHLGVLIYPKGHDRRREFTAELYTVPFFKRPFWVAGNLVRCIFEGTPERFRAIRAARTHYATLRNSSISYEDHEVVGAKIRQALMGLPKGEAIRNLSMAYIDTKGNEWVVSPTDLRYDGDEVSFGIEYYPVSLRNEEGASGVHS
jgi:hypothetical protein